jgi:hypothetical protein
MMDGKVVLELLTKEEYDEWLVQHNERQRETMRRLGEILSGRKQSEWDRYTAIYQKDDI